MNDPPATDDPWSIESTLQPLWNAPIWSAIVAICLAIGFAFWVYQTERGNASQRTRISLAGIRACLLLLVIWMLLGWQLLRYQTEKPELVLVIDGSRSMATLDEDAGSQPPISRYSRVESILAAIPERQRRALQDRFLVRGYRIGETEAPIDAPLSVAANLGEPRDAESRLGDSLIRIIDRQAGRGTAAIVFLSDGIVTSGANLASAEEHARASGIPIHSLVLGRSSALPDIRIADILADREVYLGDHVTLSAMLAGNEIQATKTTVTLSDAETQQVLDQQSVNFADDAVQRNVQLNYVPNRPGIHKLRIQVAALDGEQELENNVRDLSLQVTNKQLRVLLLQNRPSYEFRFLKHLLERTTQSDDSSTSSFSIQSVLQEADEDYVQQDQSAIRLVPSDAAQIKEFDAFVIGEFDPQLVSRRSQQLIYDAVVEGGSGCLFVYGSGSPWLQLQGWPIASLLPVQQPTLGRTTAGISQNARWLPTATGLGALPMQLGDSAESSLEIWRKLPGTSTIASVGQPKIGAQILAEVEGRPDLPLLISQFAGAGRIALQTSDETFRWTSYEGSDVYHQRYWGQLLRWISRGRLQQNRTESDIVVLPRQAKPGQVVKIQANLGNEIAETDLPTVVEVAIAGVQGDQRTLTLERTPNNRRQYAANISDLTPGDYQLRLVRPVTDTPPITTLTIVAPPGEQATLQADWEGMNTLAERSRGRFYSSADAQQLFAELPQGRPSRVGALPPAPIWNHPLLLLLFTALLTAEWLIRRKVRML